jgi:uncharacterized protein YggE
MNLKEGFEMKNRVLVSKLLVMALAVVALAGCLPTRSVSSAQTGSPSVETTVQAAVERTITVVGVGKVSLVPDIARLDVGAQDSAATVAEAKTKVDTQIAAILAALKASGVADKDIQTSNYSIYYEQPSVPPVDQSGASTERLGVYHVSNMLAVTVRDVTKAGDVLDVAVGAGANQVYGVTFTVSDESRWASQAREKAVADATSRAQELARLSGLELGQVLTISEVIGSTGVPVVAAERALGGGGGIVPGEQELSMQIQVTFGAK